MDVLKSEWLFLHEETWNAINTLKIFFGLSGMISRPF